LIAGLIAFALLVQDAPCPGEGAARMTAAAERFDAFDYGRAAEMYAAAAAVGCEGADVTAEYLRGLIAARAAYAKGGSPESLEPVRQAVGRLAARGATFPGPPEIARFVLMAAAAASQSERDEMALMIDQAIRLESLQLAAGQPGAPVITAHEVAGDLWLQVHRYEEAQRAYALAAERIGRTPRVTLGLARAASRLKDVAAACREYRALLDRWGTRDEAPAEIGEALTFVQQPACAIPN
jgi:tetratricopeptide (TPR) repeat protein